MTDFRAIAETILDWAVERDFKGYDPYDGLNSRLLGPIAKHSRLLRLITIQAVKNCPFNPRKLLLIPPGHNPKGLALFLSGIGHSPQLDNSGLSQRLQQMILSLASKPDGSPAFSNDRVIRNDITADELESSDLFAWGYNFPWQGRAFYQPAWYPTVVCSSFVLDAFQHSRSVLYPIISRKLAEFTVETLNIHEDDTGICFSYSPRDNSRVFNASLFAAKILARASKHDKSNKDRYRELADMACDYVAARQRKDGSWVYGEADHWQWVDNLHTGFVLETLNFISQELETDKHKDTILRGLEYYRNSLFEEDFTAKYYSSSKYPLDPHSYAQAAITFMELAEYIKNGRQIAESILERAVEDLWSEKQKGFIFRKYRHRKNSTVFLRWNQGWMFKALCNFHRIRI